MIGTMSTLSPLRRGQVISVGDEIVKVRRCTGSGPFTVAVRRYRWFDRVLDRVRAARRRALTPVKKWRYERCDTCWCLRKASFETEDFDAYCPRHTPEGASEMSSDG